MNRYAVALIVSASLVIGGQAWAAAPQGRGNGRGKVAAKQNKREDKQERKEAKQGVKETLRFNGLDVNGDRMITRAEWRGNDVSFRANDWNRDGVLSGDELRLGLQRPDHFLRKDFRGDLREFDKADTNHDGVLSQTEFVRWR